MRGHIEFQQVSFAYQSNLESADAKEEKEGVQPELHQALQDVNFAVAPGEVFALVGHTGAGKSTIIQLLPRLYDPTGGRILIDDMDIRRFTLDSLRNQISVVLQETVLFTGTWFRRGNIAYGRTDATRKEIIEAAIQANAHGFIEKLPEGYDTILGERGANLSGGQRQRIAIARAFIRRTPILILDEPTTGLDADSSELVLLALRMLMKGKTTIIISHDFRLVRHATRIAVLKEGRIEHMGDHRDLLKAQGIYANLYIKQFGRIKPEDEQPEDLSYYLLRSPAFQQRWPAITTAFNAEVMQAHLQTALSAPDREALGGSDLLAQDGELCPTEDYLIVRCKPGKATFLGEQGCLVRYELQVEHTPSGQIFTPLLLARIFASRDEAETYLHKRLVPWPLRSGAPELAPFAENPLRAIALLDELNMVVSVFPIDAELPVLITATNRQKMTEIFRESLPDSLTIVLSWKIARLRPVIMDASIVVCCVTRWKVAGRT